MRETGPQNRKCHRHKEEKTMRLSDIAGVGVYLDNSKGRIFSPNGMYYQNFDADAEATVLGETENHERTFAIAMPNKLYREVLYFPQILVIQYDLKRGCVRKISRIDATMENIVKCLGKLPDDLHFAVDEFAPTEECRNQAGLLRETI